MENVFSKKDEKNIENITELLAGVILYGDSKVAESSSERFKYVITFNVVKALEATIKGVDSQNEIDDETKAKLPDVKKSVNAEWAYSILHLYGEAAFSPIARMALFTANRKLASENKAMLIPEEYLTGENLFFTVEVINSEMLSIYIYPSVKMAEEDRRAKGDLPFYVAENGEIINNENKSQKEELQMAKNKVIEKVEEVAGETTEVVKETTEKVSKQAEKIVSDAKKIVEDNIKNEKEAFEKAYEKVDDKIEDVKNDIAKTANKTKEFNTTTKVLVGAAAAIAVGGLCYMAYDHFTSDTVDFNVY